MTLSIDWENDTSADHSLYRQAVEDGSLTIPQYSAVVAVSFGGFADWRQGSI
jgi:hypothetical protein